MQKPPVNEQPRISMHCRKRKRCICKRSFRYNKRYNIIQLTGEFSTLEAMPYTATDLKHFKIFFNNITISAEEIERAEDLKKNKNKKLAVLAATVNNAAVTNVK